MAGVPGRMASIPILAAALVVSAGAPATAKPPTLHVGVLAVEGREACQQRWEPTALFLAGRLGRRVTVHPLSREELTVRVAQDRLHFYLTSAPHYCLLRERYAGEAIATPVDCQPGPAGGRQGGVLFVRADSPVQALEDIAGQRFMCVRQNSFCGYQITRRMLRQAGIDPQRDCALFKEGGTPAKVIALVLQGVIDVGSVPCGSLEQLAAAGEFSLGDLRVLNPQRDDYPYAHSTPLYPGWALVRCRETDPETSRLVAAALMSLRPETQAARVAQCAGWRPPPDYGEVQRCLSELDIAAEDLIGQ